MHWIILGVAVLLTGLGGLSILYQLVKGHNRTGMNDRYVWGLNIQGFFTLSSYAAGIMALISAWILIGLPDATSIFAPAATLAFGFLIGAQILLGSDLGRPLRAMLILKGRNMISPLTWDFITLMILTVFSFLFMFGLIPQNHFIISVWAIVTLLVSIMCIAVHTMFFLPKVEAGFNSHPFTSLDIFAASIWSGVAILLLLSIGTRFYDAINGLLIVFSLIVFSSSAGAFITAKLGKAVHRNVKSLLINAVIILALLADKLVIKDEIILGPWIAMLVLVAVFIEKFDMVTEHQGKPSLPLPYSRFEIVEKYRPSIFELGSLVASVSLSVVIFYAVTILKIYIFPWIQATFL